jgi:hypothetical protein
MRPRWPAGRAAEEPRLVLGAVERELRRADYVDHIAFLPAGGDEPHVGDETDAADHGRRVDSDAVRLVVERDVAGDDRKTERLASERHALDRLGELPGDLGLLRVSEVEAVGERERPPARAGHVARGLENRLHSSRPRVERRNAPGAVQ